MVAFGRNGRPGGPTSENNGALLCGPHHRQVHAEGWIGTITHGHVHWRRTTSTDSDTDQNDAVHNAWTQQLDQALKHLAHRWLDRNPHLRPRPPDPD